MTREEFAPIFKEFLCKYDHFLIAGHEKPDGDAIGAAMAVALAIQGFGGKASLYFDGSTAEYAYVADWLPPLELEEAERLLKENRTAFILLDAADDERLGAGSKLPSLACDFLCIDHHVRVKEYERLTYVESQTSATCEILYYLFLLAQIPVTKEMAQALHMGICFDTGGFRHSSTSGDTFRMAAALVELGAENTFLLNTMYHTTSLKEMKVIGTAFRKAKLYQEGILLSAMTIADFAKTGAKPEESSGVVSRLQECAEAEVTIYLRELPDKIQASLRSKHWVDVAAVCRQFGGGGHVRAAGCSIKEPMLLAKRQILEAVRRQMELDCKEAEA